MEGIPLMGDREIRWRDTTVEGTELGKEVYERETQKSKRSKRFCQYSHLFSRR